MISPIPADSIISSILESLNESRGIEFKCSFPWPKNIDDLQNNDKAQEVIESILAMSNIRDGGKIIVGIEKDHDGKQYAPDGIKSEDLITYDQDLIFEHARNFGDPEPRFQVLHVKNNNISFIVFAVQSFMFAPIICWNRRKLRKLQDAILYIRTDKPETKKVTKSFEMREIVDLAIEKELDSFSTRMQRFFRTISGVKVLKSITSDHEKFTDELKDIK